MSGRLYKNGARHLVLVKLGSIGRCDYLASNTVEHLHDRDAEHATLRSVCCGFYELDVHGLTMIAIAFFFAISHRSRRCIRWI